MVCYTTSIKTTTGGNAIAEDKHINIPGSLIHNTYLSAKRVLVFTSIIASGWQGQDYESLVKFSLYSNLRGKHGVIDQFKDIIQHFYELGYLRLNGGTIHITKSEWFGTIYKSEFDKILNLRCEYKSRGLRLNHANILLLLAHVRLYMNQSTNDPRFYSNLLIRISKSTGLSVRSISYGLQLLEELQIIHSEELPRYTDENGRWHSNVKVFVDIKLNGTADYDWKQAVNASVEHIKSHNAKQILKEQEDNIKPYEHTRLRKSNQGYDERRMARTF